MNRKTVFAFSLALVMLLTFAGSVIAAPTEGQKDAITLSWTLSSSKVIDTLLSGPIVHRHVHNTWDVRLTFVATGDFYVGTAITERDVTIVPEPDRVGTQRNYRDYYSITFPIQEGLAQAGGFDGNAMVFAQHYGTSSMTVWTHGLFKGTGAFEGQTINAGVPPYEAANSMTWEGYLLKP